MPLLDLPPEVLCLVLEFGAEALPQHGYYTRNDYLCAASLVCRSLRWPAQATLWGSVRLSKQNSAHKWLSSHAGDYPTWDLELHGIHSSMSGVSAPTATRVLARCFGVRRLELADFKRLSAKVLESPGLSRVTNLHLLTTFPDTPTTISLIKPPFRLQKLHLFNSPYPPSLVTVLFTCSAISLTSLSLTILRTAPAYSGIVNSFHLIAPTLRSLTLHHLPSTEFVDHLRLCTHLEALSCNSSVKIADVLDAIQCPLKSLAVELDWDMNEALGVLLARLDGPALVGLATLYLRMLIPGVGGRTEQMEAECARRGIRVVIERRDYGGRRANMGEPASG